MDKDYCPGCGAKLDEKGNCPVRYAQDPHTEERWKHDMITED